MAITELSLSGVNNTKSNSLLINNSNMAPSFESIATVNITTNGTTLNAEFTNIPSSYRHLQIRAVCRSDYGGNTTFGMHATFNNDTSSNAYSNRVMYATSTTPLATVAMSTSMAIVNHPGGGTASNYFGNFICDILEYSNNQKYKTVKVLGGFNDNGNGASITTFRTNVWKSTNTISSIQLKTSGGFWRQYSSFALYGIR